MIQRFCYRKIIVDDSKFAKAVFYPFKTLYEASDIQVPCGVILFGPVKAAATLLARAFFTKSFSHQDKINIFDWTGIYSNPLQRPN